MPEKLFNSLLVILLGCIECMRCGLLLRMFAASVCHVAQLCVGCIRAAFAKLIWRLVFVVQFTALTMVGRWTAKTGDARYS